MSSNTQKPGLGKAGQSSTSGALPNTQSLLLEKMNARTSTPDSEALASSDDEGDQKHDAPYVTSTHAKPVRRSSWLNDTSQPFARPRKGSFASSSMSPTASHPSTPSAEAAGGPWGSHSASSALGRGPSNFPWGTGIWNTERKEVPTRLSEVLPSPTSTHPPGGAGNSFFSPTESLMQTSPSRDSGVNPQIPFAIPLHPTPKTYRSQSYSVGQLDPDANIPQGMNSTAVHGRARHPALQHRPSRPSMLSEMSNDGSILGKVKEVEDDEDEESASSSMQNSYHQSTESKTIEMLTRENAMLRQQQYSRLRPRASTGAAYLGNGYPLQEAVPEESDYAVDELDGDHETSESFMNRVTARRMSEYAAGGGPLRSPFGGDSRRPDSSNLKRALWSSSMGYPGGDVSQSRRHSFANMPTRQGSISSLAESASPLDGLVTENQINQDYAPTYPDNMGYAPGLTSHSYLPAMPNTMNTLQPGFGSGYPSAYGLQTQMSNRAPSPHRNNLYGNMAQPRHNQPLHVVLFKCARADVFYIQEGTGLTVKPGDLVIVEADRGTDLGTVAKDNVDWQSAKDLKEHYAEEQYKWLMMYSQGAAAANEGSGAGLLAQSGAQASAVGGMGPPTQHHMQEPSSGELRPKLIKRLAQSHEIHALRDKEGQEAKAKRVCMQKVKEHGLNMEILDAEFQMDWKKLTFYYFADAYINFNSLVTDLFKIYKTRIWMSAINPASFASPTLGIQAPSGVGPGAVNVGRGSGGERRQNQPQPQQLPSQDNQSMAFAQPQQANRGFRQPYAQQAVTDRNAATGLLHNQPNYGFGPPGGFGMNRANPSYPSNVSPNMEGFSTAGFQQPDFQTMRHRFPPGSVPSPGPSHSQTLSPLSPSSEWTGGLQGLSLNSH